MICQRKVRYETRAGASKARKRTRSCGRCMRIYQCTACGGWHLTKATR